MISVPDVLDLSPKVKPVLNLEYWAAELPNIRQPETVAALLEGLVNGVRIGRSSAEGVICSPNWPSAHVHNDQVAAIISNDLIKGRLFGPFTVPPFKEYVISPLGAIPKRGSSKVRLIHDLSFPPNKSVNDAIDSDEFSLSYTSIDDAIELINSFPTGSAIHMAKLDLQDAFKHVVVNPLDWHLLGFTWPSIDRVNQFYFSKVLNFGLRSSPALFDGYAAPLLDLMIFHGAAETTIRYVDDFLTIADGATACQLSMDTMLDTCTKAGFAVQPSKVTSPAPAVVFLGIEIDTVSRTISLPADRLAEVSDIVRSWLGIKKLTKRQLLQVLGKLNFASRVIRQGRAFMGRLIAAAKAVKFLHYTIKLSREALLDLQWWSDCLASHNGVSFMPRPWHDDSTFHIFSDASNLAVAACWGNHWYYAPFEDGFISFSDESINWRELIAVVMALNTWGELLQGSNIVFHIDNTSVCYLIHKMYSPSRPLMALLRIWALLVERYSVHYMAVYIPTDKNVDADDLSRGRIQDFKRRNPDADSDPAVLKDLPTFHHYL